MKEINVLLLEEGQELRPERVDPSPEGLTAILGQGPTGAEAVDTLIWLERRPDGVHVCCNGLPQ